MAFCDVVHIDLESAYLCPGDEHGPHITNSSTMCPCGCTNLVSLDRIFRQKSLISRVGLMLAAREGEYEGMLCDLPRIRQMFDS